MLGTQDRAAQEALLRVNYCLCAHLVTPGFRLRREDVRRFRANTDVNRTLNSPARLQASQALRNQDIPLAS